MVLLIYCVHGREYPSLIVFKILTRIELAYLSHPQKCITGKILLVNTSNLDNPTSLPDSEIGIFSVNKITISFTFDRLLFDSRRKIRVNEN